MRSNKKKVRVKTAMQKNCSLLPKNNLSTVSLRKRPKKTEEELKIMREKLVGEQTFFTRSSIWS